MDLAKLNKKIYKFYLFDLLSLVARITLGLVFILAATAKIPHVQEFQQNVANYHMLPTFLLPIFATVVPWIELIAGIYLIFGVWLKYTSYVSIILILMFMAAITYALVTNQPVTGCGCFSESGGDLIGWSDNIRDIGFLALAVIIILTNSNFLSFDKFLQKNKGNQTITPLSKTDKSKLQK